MKTSFLWERFPLESAKTPRQTPGRLYRHSHGGRTEPSGWLPIYTKNHQKLSNKYRSWHMLRPMLLSSKKVESSEKVWKKIPDTEHFHHRRGSWPWQTAPDEFNLQIERFKQNISPDLPRSPQISPVALKRELVLVGTQGHLGHKYLHILWILCVIYHMHCICIQFDRWLPTHMHSTDSLTICTILQDYLCSSIYGIVLHVAPCSCMCTMCKHKYTNMPRQC